VWLWSADEPTMRLSSNMIRIHTTPTLLYQWRAPSSMRSRQAARQLLRFWHRRLGNILQMHELKPMARTVCRSCRSELPWPLAVSCKGDFVSLSIPSIQFRDKHGPQGRPLWTIDIPCFKRGKRWHRSIAAGKRKRETMLTVPAGPSTFPPHTHTSPRC